MSRDLWGFEKIFRIFLAVGGIQRIVPTVPDVGITSVVWEANLDVDCVNFGSGACSHQKIFWFQRGVSLT